MLVFYLVLQMHPPVFVIQFLFPHYSLLPQCCFLASVVCPLSMKIHFVFNNARCRHILLCCAFYFTLICCVVQFGNWFKEFPLYSCYSSFYIWRNIPIVFDIFGMFVFRRLSNLFSINVT